ncbi:MAG: ABC transporter permease subunit [Mailhella sp.]|nr:ABC transporter permease subunit [Mailhella sp.]
MTKSRTMPVPAMRSFDAGSLLLRCSAVMASGAMLLLFVMIVAFALPVFAESGTGGPFSWTWAPGQGRFGILPMLTGSLCVGALALAIGWPTAFALCAWLLCPEGGTGSIPRAVRRFVGALVRLMTAIPTVVYGFAAVFLLAPGIRQGLGGTGFGWLTASIMLSLLILPTIVLVLQAGLRPRLEALALPGAALGMGRMELLWHVVLPQARGTLLASAVLGFGRAVGDTMLPLMLAGNASVVPESILGGTRTLTAHMALVTANEVGGAAYQSLFMAGLFLLIINAAVSLGIRRLAAQGQSGRVFSPADTGSGRAEEAML